MKFRDSAFAHGISARRIEELLANRWGMTKWFQIHDDEEGNSQDMIVGFDAEGVLVEVGISYVEDDEIIFHADIATPTWQARYNEG